MDPFNNVFYLFGGHLAYFIYHHNIRPTCKPAHSINAFNYGYNMVGSNALFLSTLNLSAVMHNNVPHCSLYWVYKSTFMILINGFLGIGPSAFICSILNNLTAPALTWATVVYALFMTLVIILCICANTGLLFWINSLVDFNLLWFNPC